jgi:transmembrane sensor
MCSIYERHMKKMKRWSQIYEWSKRVRTYLEEDFSSSSLDEEDVIVRRVTERLSDPDYLRGKGQEQGRFDAEAAFRKLRRRNSRRVMIRVGSVAAVLVLIVGIIVLYKGNFSHEKNVSKLTQGVIPALQPGTNKAILHLADGRELVLNDALRAKIETKEGVVEVDSMGVVYGIKVDSMATEKVQEYHVMTIPRGGEFHLTLADGTQVWLNSETELRFPVYFAGGERKVYLKGEAYFDVTEDAARPFVVETSMGDIKVLGTAFNVSVYDERTMAATLEKGSICYLKDSRKGVLIKPGEQLVCTEGSDLPVVRKVNTRLYTAWKDNLFCFEEQYLDQIMLTLARWYDFQVKFESEELKKLELSGTLDKYSDIQPLLRLFELGTGVKFEIQNKVIYVRKVK